MSIQIDFLERNIKMTLAFQKFWRATICSLSLFMMVTIFSWTTCLAQEPFPITRVPADARTDLPQNIKDAIKAATKKTVFEVVGVTEFKDQILKTDLLIFQPGSTLVFSGLRSGDLVLIAQKVVLQDKENANRIIRDPSFKANSGTAGNIGTPGIPDYTPPKAAYKSDNGGPGGNGTNGTSGETFRPPKVYILVDEMTHPRIPARFLINFNGVQGGVAGQGGQGGTGGHGDVGYSASCNWCCCLSGPGRGGDGGPGGAGGRGGDACAGGSGFDLILGGSGDFINIAEQFTLLNKGAQPGPPGAAGLAGVGGVRGRGGQTCGTCNARGDGVDGRFGGTLGPGSASTEVGSDGHITFVSGVKVKDLLK